MDESHIARLLQRWNSGDSDALGELIPIVYDRLHQLAHQRLKHHADERSLNTTGLVHEVYVKLVETSRMTVNDRGHFLAVASRVMRNLLVDRARARNTAKRGAGIEPAQLQEELWLSDAQSDVITELSDALERLEKLDERQSRILEQKYFGGLTLEETADALNLSVTTVKRELRSARAWLASELGADPEL